MKSRESKIALESERQGFINREIPAITCPACGVAHDGLSDTGHGDPPKTDDIVICMKCAHVNQFNEDGTLRSGSREAYSCVSEKVKEAFWQVTGKRVWYTEQSG